MGDKSIPNYAEVISRIQTVTGCETQQELANFFGIRQSSISDSKKRSSIPPDWLLTILRKRGVNPDWILTGQGAKGLRPIDGFEGTAQLHACVNKSERIRDCSIEELLTEIIQRTLRNLGRLT